jgi:hypothetical protein
MTRTIKTVLIVLIVALGALLGAKQLHLLPGGSAAKTGGDEAAPTAEVINGPRSGLPIRFDGHYRTESGDVIRLMRYFPEGRVVLINGTRELEADLHKFLIRETKGDPSIGLHNVPVEVKGDSLFFVVHPEKGDIDFLGKVSSGSSLSFERYSHINGHRERMEYIFHPDSVPSK